MTPRQFLGTLFGAAGPADLIEVRRVPQGGLQPILVPALDPDLPDNGVVWTAGNWFFATGPRTPEGVLSRCTLVWADIDAKDGPVPLPSAVLPRPTLATASGGGGVHLYWALTEAVAPDHALRLARLAALLLGADRHAVNSPSRVMRLPGTLNHKYDPPVECRVTFPGPGQEPLRWDPVDLEVTLVAQVAAAYWSKGDRHALALGLAACLARAGWSAEQAEACLVLVCDITSDDEVYDRKTAARSTVQRYADGKQVSNRAWRDALGEEDCRFFLDGLGITARDGQLVRLGETLGHHLHLEEALVDGFIAEGDWAQAEGTLFTWTGDIWAPRPEEVLKSSVFQWCRSVSQVVEGEEVPLTVTAKLAGAVASIVRGRLAEFPLPEPDPRLLPVLNGVLDPDTLELRPAKREDYFRWRIRANWDPEATCPTWDAFLAEAVDQQDPEAEIRYLQEHAGYLLVRGNPFQVLLWIHGDTDTGKSKFIETIGGLLGEGGVAIKTEKFDDYTIASLSGAMVATCTELPVRTLRTSSVKALAASDPVQARHPYGRPFTMRFPGKFWWGSNNLPPMDEGEGMWRRAKLVAFNNKPKNRNVNLAAMFKAEADGIFRWMIGGRTRVVGYIESSVWPEPPSVTRAVAEYKRSADTFVAFAADELETGPEYEVSARELYTRYASWTREHGHRVEPMGPVFRREMARLGLRPSTTPKIAAGRPVAYWVGGRLRPEIFSGNLPTTLSVVV